MTKVINRYRKLLSARAQGGFTLIELLVVIAIIAVLAAVVLVALGNARTRSRDARRVSDLNNIALALEIYVDQAADGLYPTIGTSDTPATMITQWGDLLTDLRGPDIIQGDVQDPLNTNTRVYRAQHNSAGTVRSSYLLATDLETDSTASCASDYDDATIGAAPVASANGCGEGPPAGLTPGNCDGAETGTIPVDYCICNGPACG